MTKFDEYKLTYNKVHGNKYNYDNSIYIKANEKIEIYCTVHDKTFTQNPRDHLRSTGCDKCKSELISSGNKSRIKTDISYLDEMNKIHNNKYTYNLLNKPTKKSDKISINCSIHGKFNQQLRNHLDGMGCSKCANENKPIKNDFIERAKALELPIDYSKVNYVNMITDVTLKCMVCSHEWNCRPTYHLSYQTGCIMCARKNGVGWTLDSFKRLCTDNKATIYLLKMYNDERNETFYKIGITSNTVKQRYSDKTKLKDYEYTILYQATTSVDIIWDKESTIKRYIKTEKLLYNPIIKFGGSTNECFQINDITTILNML